MLVICGCVGLAVDLLSASHNQQMTQQAIDSAASAASTHYYKQLSDGVDVNTALSSARNVGQKQFAINSKSLNLTVQNPAATVQETLAGSGVFMASISSGTPTTFGRIFGRSQVEIGASACSSNIGGANVNSSLRTCQPVPLGAPIPPLIDPCLDPEQAYKNANADIQGHIDAGTVVDGNDHWRRFGQYEGLNGNGRPGSCWPAEPCVVPERAYLREHASDVPNFISTGFSGITSGLDHWTRFGQYEGRDGVCFAPVPCGNPETEYLNVHTDVQGFINTGHAGIVSGYDHWIRFGQHEGRDGVCFQPDPCQDPEARYLQANSDVQHHINIGTVTSGYDHWRRFGQYEGLNGSGRPGSCWPAEPCVVPERHYLRENTDVQHHINVGTVTSGQDHWLQHGQYEGRAGSCWPADPCANAERNYIENNPDIPGHITAGTVTSGYDHWRRFGQYEGRVGSCWPTDACADPDRSYLQANPYVQAEINNGQFTSPKDHWDRRGHLENRPGSCWPAPSPQCTAYNLNLHRNSGHIADVSSISSHGCFRQMMDNWDDPAAFLQGSAKAYTNSLIRNYGQNAQITESSRLLGLIYGDNLNAILNGGGDGVISNVTIRFDNACNIVSDNGSNCNNTYNLAGNVVTPISLQWNAGKVFESPTITSFKVNPDSSHKFTWRGSSNMPLLVWDETGDGNIKDGKQLFGDHTFGKSWDHGYHALGSLDANKDGIIKGDELRNLSLWFDANRDGVSDAGEVKRLSDENITELYYTDYTRAENGDWELAKGYKRIKNGQEEILPSIDWYANEVPSLTHLFYNQYAK